MVRDVGPRTMVTTAAEVPVMGWGPAKNRQLGGRGASDWGRYNRGVRARVCVEGGVQMKHDDNRHCL